VKVRIYHLLGLALLLGGLTACVSSNPPVTPIPNVTIRHTVGEALLVKNATTAALTLLAGPEHPNLPEITLSPGQSTGLDFSLTQEQNKGDTVVNELVLDAEHSSPYLQQPATDLIIRARFGSSKATKLIPIAIGLCLFDEPAERHKHPVRIDKPPTAGVPFLQLCPE
jgi:hypothetical protein